MRDLRKLEKELGKKYRPVEYKVLLLADKVEEMTKSGLLFMPETSQDRQQIKQDRGRILAIGGKAFEDFGAPYPKVGDKVLMNRHSGYRMMHREDDPVKREDLDLRVVNDKDITVIMEEEPCQK